METTGLPTVDMKAIRETTMATKQQAVLVRQIIQGQISRHFGRAGRRIERQSVTVLPVADGQHGRFAGSTVVVHGQTNLTESAWAVYEVRYGKWQALVSPLLRVGWPHEIV